jgi:hypothetical protein
MSENWENLLPIPRQPISHSIPKLSFLRCFWDGLNDHIANNGIKRAKA